MPRWLKILFFLVALFSFFWPARHNYGVGPTLVCAASWRCTPELIDKTFLQVRHAIAGNPSREPIESGNKYIVYQFGVPMGLIRSEVGSGPTVSNFTTPVHVFHDGHIVRKVFQVEGAWYSTTVGEGTHRYLSIPMAIMNQMFGPIIFGGLDKALEIELLAVSQNK